LFTNNMVDDKKQRKITKKTETKVITFLAMRCYA